MVSSDERLFAVLVVLKLSYKQKTVFIIHAGHVHTVAMSVCDCV